MRRFSLLLVLCVGLAWLWPSPTSAQASNVKISIDRVAYNNTARDGAWVPVVVTVENSGADLQGRLELSAPFSSFYSVAQPLDLPGGSRKQITLLWQAFSGQSDLQAEFVADNGQRSRPQRLNINVLPAGSAFTAIFGGPPSILAGFEIVGRQSEVEAGLPAELLPSTDAELLNFAVIGLSGVQPTPAQVAALQRWVAVGGVLLVDAGPTQVDLTPELQELAQVQPQPTVGQISDLTLNRIRDTEQIPAQTLATRPLTLRADARVIAAAAEDGQPLLVEHRIGLGRVVTTAFDASRLEVDTLNNWNTALAVNSVDNWSISMRWMGGQLLDQNLPPPGLIALLIFIYLLVIGPGNYFLLRRLDRRELAWITLPASVLLFTALTYLAGGSLRGAQAQPLQLAVVEAGAGQTSGRVSAVVGFAAGRRGTWSAQFQADEVVGMSANRFFGDQQNLNLFQSSDGIFSIPRWNANVGDIMEAAVVTKHDLPFSVSLQPLQRLADGSIATVITNTGTTSIDAAYLAFEGGYVALDSLAPGQSIPVDVSSGLNGWPFDNQQSAIVSALQSGPSSGMLPSPMTTPHLLVFGSEVVAPLTLANVDAAIQANTVYVVYVPEETE